MKQPKQSTQLGHLAAIITILIWGTTFISTKILLRSFSPIEILFLRFAIGFILLFLLAPKRLKLTSRRQKGLLAAAGISGITLYYLLENVALTMTTASNVGIIITIAPFFTGLLSTWFLKQENPKWWFYAGFVLALFGIGLISLGGNSLQLNPTGDLLAILAAATWAVYSILTRKISELGHNIVQSTRYVFGYGLLFMLPMCFVMNFQLQWRQFTSVTNWGNLLFLGVAASALCFVTWNTAVGILGAVKTSVYIYLVPIATVATSVLILKEPLTPMIIIGTSLTLIGLWLSKTRLFESKSTEDMDQKMRTEL